MERALGLKREGISHSKVFAWLVFHKSVEDLSKRFGFDLRWKWLTVEWHAREPQGDGTCQTRKVIFGLEYQDKPNARFEIFMQGSFSGQHEKWTYAEVSFHDGRDLAQFYRFNAGAINRANETNHMQFVCEFSCDASA